MKILIINWRDPFDPKSGGAEQVTVRHAAAWAAAGHTITWLSGSYPGAQAQETVAGITYYRKGNSATLFLRAAWIYWFTFSGKFDLVVDEIHGIPAFSPLWAWKSARLAFIHEVAGSIWRAMFPLPIAVLGEFFETHIFPFVYKNTPFWVDCKSTKLDLVSLGIAAKNITVIPCAHAAAELVSLEKNTTLQLIFIARLVPMKGLHLAVAVLRHILEKQPDATLLVVGVGDPTYIKNIEYQAADLGKSLVFLGKVSDLEKNKLLRASHFLLHTSIKEGFGLTVLEANGQKTPAAVFDVHGLRDLVIPDKTGLLAPFGDSPQLAEKILAIYGNKSAFARISEYAYNYSKKFQWKHFTPMSLDLITKIVELKRK